MARTQNPNLEIIETAARALGPMCDELVFLGGCATVIVRHRTVRLRTCGVVSNYDDGDCQHQSTRTSAMVAKPCVQQIARRWSTLLQSVPGKVDRKLPNRVAVVHEKTVIR